MLQLLRRASFTARLLALAGGVLVVLVVIDYVALLELPGRVAKDTVEIALRENVQSLNATFAEDRTELRDQADPFVGSSSEFRRAVLRDDERAVQQLVRTELGEDVRSKLVSRNELASAGIGPVSL